MEERPFRHGHVRVAHSVLVAQGPHDDAGEVLVSLHHAHLRARAKRNRADNRVAGKGDIQREITAVIS